MTAILRTAMIFIRIPSSRQILQIILAKQKHRGTLCFSRCSIKFYLVKCFGNFFFTITHVRNKNNNKWGWLGFNRRCNSKRSAQLFLAMTFLLRAILCSTKRSWSNLWNKSSFLLIQGPVICWKKSHSDLTAKVHFNACVCPVPLPQLMLPLYLTGLQVFGSWLDGFAVFHLWQCLMVGSRAILEACSWEVNGRLGFLSLHQSFALSDLRTPLLETMDT